MKKLEQKLKRLLEEGVDKITEVKLFSLGISIR